MREHARIAPAPSVAAFADRLEGRAALAAGNLERAIELLTAASAAFADLQAPWERALTDLDLGRALAAAGRTDDARRVLVGAVAAFERLGAARDVARARDGLAGLG